MVQFFLNCEINVLQKFHVIRYKPMAICVCMYMYFPVYKGYQLDVGLSIVIALVLDL